MNDTLIGVYSCNKNILRVNHIERLKMYEGVEHYYVVSKYDTEFPLENKIVVDVEIGYENLIYTTVEFLKYFLNSKYEYCFKCDDDSFVDISRLKCLNYKNFDYCGYLINTSVNNHIDYYEKKGFVYEQKFKDKYLYKFAVGGGYFLSKKAAECVVENYKNSYEYYRHNTLNMRGCEDRMVGQMIHNHKKFKIYNHGKLYNPDMVFYSIFFDSIYHSINPNLYEKIPHKSLGHYIIGKWIENDFV